MAKTEKKAAITVEVKFKDLRQAVVLLNESKKPDGKPMLAEKIKLIGVGKDVILADFMKGIESIPDIDGKFPGPKQAIDFYNKILDDQEKATKGAEPSKPPVAAAGKKAAGKKAAGKKTDEPRVTKKSIIIEMVSKGGATLDEMATACTKAGLGDQERNVKTVGLWLRKLGVPVKKDEKTGKYTKSK
jgi:hypothetical protein